jgi:hypothetical protein
MLNSRSIVKGSNDDIINDSVNIVSSLRVASITENPESRITRNEGCSLEGQFPSQGMSSLNAQVDTFQVYIATSGENTLSRGPHVKEVPEKVHLRA